MNDNMDGKGLAALKGKAESMREELKNTETEDCVTASEDSSEMEASRKENPENMETEHDSDEERRRLEEENEALRKELELMREKNVKERIYDHVHVSVRTMDIFIGIMVVLFIAVIVIGLINK